ncbi:DUF3574 domain-containing protein [Acetobacteraceae bacterium KSS8]|uniref:DUF3574 domain-containing protein n=1 Tax=Endosaccharibacter trunci TaxID=2812733 RepID=A0ABT1W8S5_9PROT|nr:DUF3574 domain-containing protein [Acetobacteraceae bacterium KSS8]
MGARHTVLVALLAVSGCTATAPDDPAHPVQAVGWAETRLSFGLGPADDKTKGVSEQRWRAFLDREVTPRFPSGLSVIDMYGQWRDPGAAAPERLRSRLLVIDHPDDADDAARLNAIRDAWKRMTGDRSVLSVTQTARVSF